MAVGLIALVAAAPAARTSAGPQAGRDLVLQKPEGRRLALVVGNDTYPRVPLTNARNDARAMAAALTDLGFRVTTVENVTREQMATALANFGDSIRSIDLAWFFYAGHGLQVGGENFLVPVDFAGSTENSVRLSTMPVSEVQSALGRAQVSVVVLDACRNNPFLGARSGGRGLAPMEARGSLIAFATGAGQTASDNEGAANGLFTQELLHVIREPAMGIRDVFFRVRERVLDQSKGTQFPAVYDGLVGNFTLHAAAATTSTAEQRPLPVVPPPAPAVPRGGGGTKWLLIGGGAAAAAGAAVALGGGGGGSSGSGSTNTPTTNTSTTTTPPPTTTPPVTTPPGTNRAPVITSATVTPATRVLAGGGLTTFTALVSDPDGDPIAATFIFNSFPSAPQAVSGGRVSSSTTINPVGPFNVSVSVSDGTLSTSQAFETVTATTVTGSWNGTVGSAGCSGPTASCFTFRMTLTQSANLISGDYSDQFGRTARVTGSVRDVNAFILNVPVDAHPVAGAAGTLAFSFTGNTTLDAFTGTVGGSTNATLSR